MPKPKKAKLGQVILFDKPDKEGHYYMKYMWVTDRKKVNGDYIYFKRKKWVKLF